MDTKTRFSAEVGNDPESSCEHLRLDEATLEDLQILGSDANETSLFQFCNFTRSRGGEKALLRRMKMPWCTVERIRATQSAIAFITRNRHLFERLPSGFSVNGVENYLQDILPRVEHDNFIEFTIDAYTLWAQHDHHYFAIVRGSKITRQMVHNLKLFIDQAGMAEAAGELQPLLTEITDILSRPRFSKLPRHKQLLGVWRTLKVDRDLRCHESESLRRLLQLVYELEALVSLADATEKHGLHMPEVFEGAMQVRAEGVVHPYIEYPVENPVQLNQDIRGIFLTGPNMAGKTTYIRAFGVALYLAHLGMGVPARSFEFTPVQKLFSSISLSDDLLSGVSYFRAEALRVKDIASAITEGYRVVAIMDEPFKGTNVKDTHEASLAILSRFAARPNCLFMFSSHQIELSNKLEENALKIACRYFAAIESEARLRFDYLLREGVSSQRIGMRVLREEGVFELLDGAGLSEFENRL